MKTKTILGLGILLMSATSYSPLTAEETTLLTEGNDPIIIRQDPVELPEAPRMPVHIPFIAELMDGSNSVLLGATDTIGIVSVQITSTSGDNYSTYFDTSDGAILLPISGNAGYYTLTIIATDGTHFVGEFTI